MKNLRNLVLFSLIFLVVGCSKDEEDSPTPLYKQFQNIEIEVIYTNWDNPTVNNDKVEFELSLDNLDYSKIPNENDWDNIKTFGSFYLCNKIVKQNVERRIVKFQQCRVIFSFSLTDLNKKNSMLYPHTVILRINGEQKELWQVGEEGVKTWSISYQEKK